MDAHGVASHTNRHQKTSDVKIYEIIFTYLRCDTAPTAGAHSGSVATWRRDGKPAYSSRWQEGSCRAKLMTDTSNGGKEAAATRKC